jgi:flavodoxin
VSAPSSSVAHMAGPGPGPLWGRRAVLRAAVLGAAGMGTGVTLGACDSSAPSEGPADPTRRPSPSGSPSEDARGGVLLAYFSRAGENYHYGGRRDLEVGNTQVVAELIGRLTGCDVHRIEPADPYPDDYEETRVRNVREQDDDARPAIANPLPAVANYRTVLLGSPIWSVRTPLIMTTFTEGLDLRGKTVHPLVTYAVSGIGDAERNYAESCPGATIGESLAVRGEEVADADPGVQPAVESWLRRIGLLR